MRNYKKEFVNYLMELCGCGLRSTWEVWKDFIDISSISFSNIFKEQTGTLLCIREDIWNKREDEYFSIIHKYAEAESSLFTKMLAVVIEAYEANSAQDFLGELYMDLNLGSKSKNQYFTPYRIAEMMSKLQSINNFGNEFKRKEYISVEDPTCGSGVMLLAFANVCKSDYNINFQNSVLFVAQDIDPTVAKMCYIQLSILGCAGYVVIGNSLLPPINRVSIYSDENVWITPMLFSYDWRKKISEQIKDSVIIKPRVSCFEHEQLIDIEHVPISTSPFMLKKIITDIKETLKDEIKRKNNKSDK